MRVSYAMRLLRQGRLAVPYFPVTPTLRVRLVWDTEGQNVGSPSWARTDHRGGGFLTKVLRCGVRLPVVSEFGQELYSYSDWNVAVPRAEKTQKNRIKTV
jgi:hypothetical protein